MRRTRKSEYSLSDKAKKGQGQGSKSKYNFNMNQIVVLALGLSLELYPGLIHLIEEMRDEQPTL